LVLHTVALLIIVGGLSPLAIVSLPALIRRRTVPLQVKLVMSMTVLLLAVGTIAYLSFEWSGSLAHLAWGDRVDNAWFQSVTLRTAGFNSVDLLETRSATRSLMLAMMFVGGSPGGTAGGIKTTSAAVLLLAVVAALRGQTHIAAFGRHVRHTSVYKAVAVTTVGLLSCMVATTAIQLTQSLPFDVGIFEVVSALGTVGLSLDGTGHLDEVGKVVIMVCMFMGRVGPLTLFLFLAEQRSSATWRFTDEEVDVG
jgi:trk system potassium uptake protein TrkH